MRRTLIPQPASARACHLQCSHSVESQRTGGQAPPRNPLVICKFCDNFSSSKSPAMTTIRQAEWGKIIHAYCRYPALWRDDTPSL